MDDYQPEMQEFEDYSYQYTEDDSNRKRSQHSDIDDDATKKRRTQQSQRRLNKDGSEKPKLSRGSRACLVCRRVKMRCIGASEGVKCKRCSNGGHECIFEESNRGRRSTKKSDQLSSSLKSMGETLGGVLKNMAPGTPPSEQSPYSQFSPANSAEASTSRLAVPPYSVNSMDSQTQPSMSNYGRPMLNHQAVKTLEKLMGGTQAQQIEAASWIMQFQESVVHFNNQILDQNLKMERLQSKQLPQPGGHLSKGVTPLDQLVSAFQVSSPKLGSTLERQESTAAPMSFPTPAYNRQASFDKPFDRPAAIDKLKLPQNVPPQSPKLHSLPDDTLNPLGLLAEASLNNRRYTMRNSQRPDLTTILNNNEEKDENGTKISEKERNEQVEALVKAQNLEGIGVASEEYYRPGPMSMLPLRRIFIERQVRPEILSFCTEDNIKDLFTIFYRHLNMHTYILDEDFHTPSLVASRSPFLLTAICAVSSKFYDKEPALQAKLNAVARKLAFDVPSQGFKSVEIVMAYLILVYWGVGPSRRFEEDKTWLLLGLALRVATDLNLHRKSSLSSMPGINDVQREQELRCRERIWILCYITDRSLSSQMGKPSSISLREDYIIRHVSDWARQSSGNPRDYCVAAYCELQRIVSRFIDFHYSSTATPSGLGTDINYMLITVMFESQLLSWYESVINANETIVCSEEQHDYIINVSKFMFNYWTLAIFSFGLQSALETNSVDFTYFFTKCYHSAQELLLITKEVMAPRGWLKYSVDSHFVFITYATVSLMKFMRPQFSPYHSVIGIDNSKIINQVSEIASLLASVAVDSKHTPALYAAFLQALIGPPTTGHDDDQLKNRNEIFDKLMTDDIDKETTLKQSNDENHGESANGLMDEGSTYMPPPITSMASQSDEYGSAAGFEGTNVDYISMDLNALNEQAQAMDALYQNGFWENVLLPGFGGPLDSISGGVMRSGYLTPKGITPSQTPRNISRPQTPGTTSQQYVKPKHRMNGMMPSNL
ncbi:hypothetical protein E3Q22_00829 [Wallemia mellicola]|uniref:Zn(2)-C6 fungal-type domain-containing protein n=1 Tax=Wallemia mellicola TaxID=1708541 RepID=A0A4T0PYZ3_9BASI|nr:hypothetical protein E3Q22_00829 [Wallemia mellicola]TIC04152.1 hypothetical protein E3Q17_00526 [Wallemia mellicola]TIC13376.1 hypothetical protein E3Q13_03943 [Wallemia mellicola]TIC16521.1 hypothetical protein E3Q15_01118 [Wallemia mellicola]TIC49110.1 hypothetical protein E3Q05_03898 [Wallemia mellicola]